jgi:hypothetical protein
MRFVRNRLLLVAARSVVDAAVARGPWRQIVAPAGVVA